MIKDLLSLTGICAFSLGIALAYTLNLPGRIRLGEVVLVAMLPLVLHWARDVHPHFKKQLYRVIGALAGLVFWHGFADFISGTPIDKTVDVVATFGLCGLKLFVISVFFLKFPDSVVPWLLGSALGNFLLTEEVRTSREIMQNEYWDLKVAHWASPLLISFIIVVGKSSKALITAGAFFYGLAAAYFGARAHGMLVIIASVLPFFLSTANKMQLVKGRRSIWKLAALCALIGSVMTVVYVQAALAGLVTKKSQEQLSQIKNPYNPVQLIWSGRPGTIIGLEGALKKPITGFGSMQFHNPKYGITSGPKAWQVIHSMIAESMVYGGLVTVVFWYLIVVTAFDLYPSIPSDKQLLNGYYFAATVVLVGLYWGILFSPLVSARFTIPLAFALLFSFNQRTARSLATGANPV